MVLCKPFYRSACNAWDLTNRVYVANYNCVSLSATPSEKNNYLIVKSSVNFFSKITIPDPYK